MTVNAELVDSRSVGAEAEGVGEVVVENAGFIGVEAVGVFAVGAGVVGVGSVKPVAESAWKVVESDAEEAEEAGEWVIFRSGGGGAEGAVLVGAGFAIAVRETSELPVAIADEAMVEVGAGMVRLGASLVEDVGVIEEDSEGVV